MSTDEEKKQKVLLKKIGQMTPLQYVNYKNELEGIDKDTEEESKDLGTQFWNEVTLYPEQSVKHICPKCQADHIKFLSSETFKFQCKQSCFWYDRFAGLRSLV